MGKVIAQASMSLDGFITDTNDQVGRGIQRHQPAGAAWSSCGPSTLLLIRSSERTPRQRHRSSAGTPTWRALSGPRISSPKRTVHPTGAGVP